MIIDQSYHVESLLAFRGKELTIATRWRPPVLALSTTLGHSSPPNTPLACFSRSLADCLAQQFFSNVERLRIRLAQSDPSSPASVSAFAFSPPNHHVRQRTYRPSARPGSGPFHSRALRNASTSSLTRRHDLEKRPPQKLRKPASLQLAYLVAQADSQCYHSLPAKVQQKLFSPEERRRLRYAYRDSIILDAAHEAFSRRPTTRHHRPSTDSHPSEATLPVAQPSTVFWDSDSDSEDEIDPDSKMDQSLYDSFRWIDEDGDLDLSLDEYHAHVANAVASKSRSRRRASFRQSLSFSTSNLRHRPTISMAPRGLPASQSVPPIAPFANRRSTSRPASRHKLPAHAPRTSTSSIDPAAQYYQDPDARFKLRVYLASPQKFDEAIEFGFPALDQDKENVAPEQLTSPEPTPISREAGTFFEDDDGTVVGSPGGSVDEEPAPSRLSSQLRETPRPSMDSSTVLQRRQTFLTGPKVVPQRLPGNREMTLKMTLTRPDLRTESPTPSQPSQDDPLQLAALPPADRNQNIWDSDLDDHGVVKKMWRKLRRRA